MGLGFGLRLGLRLSQSAPEGCHLGGTGDTTQSSADHKVGLGFEVRVGYGQGFGLGFGLGLCRRWGNGDTTQSSANLENRVYVSVMIGVRV